MIIFLYLIVTLTSYSKLMKDDIKVFNENIEQEKYYDEEKKVFFNPHNVDPKGFGALFKWMLTSNRAKWPDYVENKYKFEYLEVQDSNEIIITYINHSSFLIQLKGCNILTDPVFSERVSPFSWVGPKRVRDSGIKIEELPKIDVILVSHNHYDHLDINSLIEINKKHSPLFLIPANVGELLLDNEIDNFIELKWWQTSVISNNLKVTFTPAQHFSGRGVFDRFQTLWGSFLINYNENKVYFGGDTGYSDHFKKIGDYFKEIDIAFIPIGAYEPRWFMRDVHTNPDDAVLAHKDLHSKFSIGMNFGTFQLTDEAINQPIEDLKIAKIKHNLDVNEFQIFEIGKSYKLKFTDK